MRKRFTLLSVATLLFCFSLSAQTSPAFNSTLISNLDYSDGVNDIWGYVAPDGTEYALVGLRNGVSIVSLADPANPQEVANVPGANSLWRDLKSWDEYAYVTNETGQGLLIIDLTDLPASVDSYNFTPELNLGMQLGTLTSAHNLYIDENGFCYVVGSNLNSGGAVIFDLNADPWVPAYVGKAPNVYSHDVYAVNNKMYTSDIYAGVFSVYDVTNKDNIQYLGGSSTPFQFTHNAWLSTDGNYLFTTDEQGNAPVGSYDISDLTDIVKIDEFRPPGSLNTGTIPHNVHVKDGYLFISYYTDGLVVVDANNPSNLVEVAGYDTWPGSNGGFDGCWGAYPFLPSGLILATDQSTGLYVISPVLQRACYLEGNVTDSQTGDDILGVSLEILNTNITDQTDGLGDYKTGYATAGTYDVVFTKSGYASQTISVDLLTSQTTVADVALDPLESFLLIGEVRDADDSSPISGAAVEIKNNQYLYEANSNGSGLFAMGNVFSDNYNITSGKWTYETIRQENVSINAESDVVLELNKQIVDPFEVHLGWSVTGDAQTGGWVRGVPVGTSFGGSLANPAADVNGDVGEKCFVTGNGGGGGGTDDVDNGTTTLTSPVFDLSTMNDAYVAYNLWFVNGGGNGNPDDQFVVRLSNGTDEVVIETVTESMGSWRPRSMIRVSDFLTPSAEMRIIFETSDLSGSGHIVEAGVDYFEAYDADPTTGVFNFEEGFQFTAYPNPFNNEIAIDYNLDELDGTQAYLRVSNILGQSLYSETLNSGSGQTFIGAGLGTGVYFVQIISGDRASRSLKIVKTR